MKIQAAIDRVSLEAAIELVEQLQAADIIELGTSLSKDFGLASVTETRDLQRAGKLLADIKTIDEGEYEFRRYFEAGTDILTVMGASAKATLDICYQVTQEFQREMLIDLLECSDKRIAAIADSYPNAIYGMHFAKDAGRVTDVAGQVTAFKEKFPEIRRVALAGGLKLADIPALKAAGLEVAIIGSAITGAKEPALALKTFMEAAK